MRLLRRLHRWAGLVLALPLMVQGVTGCIMAMDPLFTSPIPATDLPPSTNPAAIIDVAQRVVPGLVPRRYHKMAGAAPVVDFAPSTQVVVDPTSLRVLTVGPVGGGFYRWIHSLHETFLLGPAGRRLVGFCGIGMLCLGLSGLVLWWPAPGRWRRAIGVSREARGVRLMRELHGTGGFWLLGLLLLQSLSGAALAFPQTARAVMGLDRLPPGDRGGALPLALPIGAAMAASMAAVPDGLLEEMRFPANQGRPIVAFLRPHGQWSGAPAVIVTLDAATGRALSVQNPYTGTWGAWALAWLRALHFGAGLGAVWRLVVIGAGLALPLFPLTGIVVWWRRRRPNRRESRLWRWFGARRIENAK